ncbi:MAG TPA: response regulator [Candidatus Nitrosotalea sp.]|nr:response regulator [Candidatus Nitrosotalea sp.]
MKILSNPHVAGNSDPITAIVIDDDKDTVSVLCDFLQIKGIKVIGRGYDGLEAIEIYKKLRPDVVFLDVMMEGYDGIYGLEKIKEIRRDAIVIMVTADMTVSTHDKLITLDASAIVYKPYDINEIMHLLGKLSTMRKAA